MVSPPPARSDPSPPAEPRGIDRSRLQADLLGKVTRADAAQAASAVVLPGQRLPWASVCWF